MSKNVFTYVGSVRQKAIRMFVYVGDVRQKVTKGFVYVDGVRQQFFPELNVQLPSSMRADVTNSIVCTAQLQFRTDGWIWKTNVQGTSLTQYYQWLKQGVASDYTVHAHTFTGSPGTLTAGPTTPTQITGTIAFTRQSGVANNQVDVSFVIELRKYAGGALLMSSNATLTAERYT